ncbi:MAG: HlyD family efflux transporter periplasmic adaptor subunit [Planctomycetota bacterium]
MWVIAGAVNAIAPACWAQDSTGPSIDQTRAPSPGQADPEFVIPDAQTSLIQDTNIAAPIGGLVREVIVQEGVGVSPGMTLLRFDDDEAQAELTAARASLDAALMESENDVDARYAERSLQVQQRELEQSQKANDSFAGAISGTELERLRLMVDQSSLAIEQARHDQRVAIAKAKEKQAAVRLAMTRLSKFQVASPVRGDVAEVSVEPGEWVEQGQPLLRVISLDPIRVECFIDGMRYGKELVGTPVRYFVDRSMSDSPGTESPSLSEGVTLQGKVAFVSSELHSVTGQARLWATLDNPEQRVRAGMRGTLTIEWGQD